MPHPGEQQVPSDDERRNRWAGPTVKVLVLLLLISLPLQGSVQGASSAAAAHLAERETLDAASATSRAAKTPKVFLRLKEQRVTTKERARAKVVVSSGAGARAQSEKRFGRVRILVKGGGKTRHVLAVMADHRKVVDLPRLPRGSYKVRAVFLGNDVLGKTYSKFKKLTVVRANGGGPAGWPNASNTGVPDGVDLSTYTGPCTITAANTVIDSKTIGCEMLLIQAANVTIRKSRLGRVLVDTDINQNWSLTISDSEVDAGAGDYSAVSNGNVTIERTDIRGGHNGLECQEHASYCEIRDSWIHDQWQPPSGDFHLGGLLHLGTQVPCTGTNGACVEIVHNTIVCDTPVNDDGGGCTGDINLLPHWGPLNGAIVVNNYLGANPTAAYCTYGGAGMEYPATDVVYRDNVFERGSNRKCAAYGPVTNFDSSATGNVWTNNRWDDGTIVRAAR